tara:strand:+ start:505 stop:636 length:132 start_codon:yes stop_codon:yes gene_type:complete
MKLIKFFLSNKKSWLPAFVIILSIIIILAIIGKINPMIFKYNF